MRSLFLIPTVLTAFCIVNVQAQNAGKPRDGIGDIVKAKNVFSSLSVDLGYIVSSNSNNSKESKPLFVGNGFGGGVSFRYGGVLGGVVKTMFATGSVSKTSLSEFGSKYAQSPYTIRTSSTKSNWSRVIFTAGPSVSFAKYKGEINFVVGVNMGGANTVKVDLYDINTFYKNVYTGTERKIRGYWEVETKYTIAQFNKVCIGLRAGYGANGASVGIGAIVCLDPICRCRLFGDCKSSSKVIND